MLHAKFQCHRNSCFAVEDFYHILAWQPSLSCDLDHFKWLHIKIGFDRSSGFRGD